MSVTGIGLLDEDMTWHHGWLWIQYTSWLWTCSSLYGSTHFGLTGEHFSTLHFTLHLLFLTGM